MLAVSANIGLLTLCAKKPLCSVKSFQRQWSDVLVCQLDRNSPNKRHWFPGSRELRAFCEMDRCRKLCKSNAWPYEYEIDTRTNYFRLITVWIDFHALLPSVRSSACILSNRKSSALGNQFLSHIWLHRNGNFLGMFLFFVCSCFPAHCRVNALLNCEAVVVSFCATMSEASAQKRT